MHWSANNTLVQIDWLAMAYNGFTHFGFYGIWFRLLVEASLFHHYGKGEERVCKHQVTVTPVTCGGGHLLAGLAVTGRRSAIFTPEWDHTTETITGVSGIFWSLRDRTWGEHCRGCPLVGIIIIAHETPPLFHTCLFFFCC